MALGVVVMECGLPKIAINVVQLRITPDSSSVLADHFGARPAVVGIQGNAHRSVEDFAAA